MSWLSRAGAQRHQQGLVDPVHSAVDRVADTERTTKLLRAVRDAVEPGHRVLHLGAGAGLLALAAAEAGAVAVDAYEWDPETAAQARRNVAANGRSSVIEVLEDDVRSAPYAGPYDVVIADLVSVGLASSPLVPALNHLISRRSLSPEVRVIPAGQSTFAELVEVDEEHHGFRLPAPHVERPWLPRRVRATMSGLRLVSNPDLEAAARSQEPLGDLVVALLDIEIAHSGTVNALRLTSMTHLAPDLDSGTTTSANHPLVLPVKPRSVHIGSEVRIELSWRMGAGATGISFQWIDDESDTIRF